MGQQQILLIVLSVILVGIAVSVGIGMFSSYSRTANRDAIVLDIINLSVTAYQYRFKPSSMGGGSGSFDGFNVPPGLDENENATYDVEINGDGDEITIVATSKLYDGATITATYDLDLELVSDDDGEGGGTFNNGFRYQGWRSDN